MMHSKKIVLLFIISFATAYALAQPQNNEDLNRKYRVVNWGVDEGLAHNQVYCMLKDVNGFLWIGTKDGLSRFDGSTFKNYYYDPKKRGSISGVRVLGLVEDSLHNIWIGTDKGLTRYDITADSVSNFFPDSNARGLTSFVIPFWATRDKIYCQEAESLITAFDIHSFKSEILVKLTPDDSLVWQSGYASKHSILDSTSNSIWALSYSVQGRLLQINLATGKREFHKWPGNLFGEAMCYDNKRKSIWINTDGGLFEFTIADKQFHHPDALNELEKLKPYFRYVGVDIDPWGRIWFSTHPKGIVIYDPKSNSAKIPFPEDSLLQQKISYNNGAIYCDRDGMIWSGFWMRKGVYQIIPFSQPVTDYLADSVKNHIWQNIIFNCIKAGNGKIWMGTDEDGIILFDPQAKSFQHLRQKDVGMGDKSVLVPVMIDTIAHKALLKCHDRSMKVIDMTSREYREVMFTDGNGHPITTSRIYSCIPFKSNCLSTATYGDTIGVFLVDLVSGIANEIMAFPKNTIQEGYAATNGHDGLFLNRGNVSDNLSYVLVNDKWVRRPTPLDTIRWTRIFYNKVDESYWTIASRELIHFNKNFEIISHYGPEDGLPHDEVFALVGDNKGNIWFNTYRQIYKLNIKTGTIISLSEKDGFRPRDFRQAGPAMLYDDGDLYFPGGGSAQGFAVIHPDNFESRSVSVYLKSIDVRQFTLPSSLGANSIQHLSLKYFQNNITVETGVIDFFTQGKGHIRYKVLGEGRKDEWIYAPINYTIRYEELPPGKYSLLIQASNAGNEFTGSVKTLTFQISTAFWNTWWFRIPVGIVLLGLLYYFIRGRLQQKFRLQLERSENETQLAEMRQKTAELQQQATELEMQALRAQMNPHFIFNSLNSINRFILQNNRTQASEYLTKFSKLVRLILQNSQATLISLEVELEALALYLDLESVRFDHRFGYKISVPKDLDVEVLKVPPLIIQPYAENAIWHGLMHKEEKGHLDIEVNQEKDQLIFRIADDGIGRKAAAELASKSATKHKSMGLKITADRIAMLQNSNGKEPPVTFVDLTHSDGTAAGTEVIIKMPVIYD